MQRRLVALLLAFLAGCLGAPDDAPAAPSPRVASPDAGARDGPDGARAPVAGLVAEAPDLPLGRAWTFAADGVYNSEPEFTVVVAARTGTGYLFAAADERGLAEGVGWGRAHFGARDRHLNPEGSRLFDFPLSDGKSWTLWDRTVTAREADVAVPGGSERGFVIEGETAGSVVRYEYAPSVGWLTRFETTRGGVAYQRATLTSVGVAESWLWVEAGSRADAWEESPTASLVVPAGFDAVLVVGGGSAGARGAIASAPALAPPWTFEAAEPEQWFSTRLPAQEGVWSVAVASQPGGFAYAAAIPVKWVRGEV